MRTAYRLENFKAFQDTGVLELAPITILCGENSIGKSSILKSLLLLRQSTAERRSRLARNAPTQPFLFNGELTRLGSWSDTVHGKTKRRQIRMSWSASGSAGELPNRGRVLWGKQNRLTKFDVDLAVSLRSVDTEMEELSTVLASASVRSGQLRFDFDEAEKAGSEYSGLYNCKIRNLRELLAQPRLVRASPYFENGFREVIDLISTQAVVVDTGNMNLQMEGPFPISVLPVMNSSWNACLDLIVSTVASARAGIRGPRPGWLTDLSDSVRQFKKATQGGAEYILDRLRQDFASAIILLICSNLDYGLSFISDALSPMWKRLRYLGPLRSQPQRFYQFDDTGGIDIGVSGEFTVQVLALEANNVSLVSGVETGTNGLISLVTPRQRTLLEATNDWLSIMGLPAVHPNVLRQSLYELRVGTLDVALPDVGFGVSQVLPIVVEALRSRKGDTLILEQPEIHLHPKVQASLADFLIARANDGIKFIVESHSEYFIKRLCRRISEGTFPKVETLINIIFIDRGLDDVANCKRVHLNEYGEIENWPTGFFDTQEDLYWTEAALRRRRSAATARRAEKQ